MLATAAVILSAIVILGVLAEDDRCNQPPASLAPKLMLDQCLGKEGFSWYPDLQNCMLEPEAGCARSTNKFKTREMCLNSCLPNSKLTSDREAVMDDARCGVVPLIFSGDPSTNGGFHPKPCPSEELHGLKIFYYDWNVKKCIMSNMKVCPGDLSDVFSGQLNSFSRLDECLKTCAPKNFVCKLPFVSETNTVDKTGEHTAKFSFNEASMQCESFIVPLNDTNMEGNVANQFDSLEECEGICLGGGGQALAIDRDMPSPSIPQKWQCTDTAALRDLSKNRSACLAYDNSYGYTYFEGQCVPSDYNGCIDTYNKFRDLDTCASTCLEGAEESCRREAKKDMPNENKCEQLAHALAAFTFDSELKECVSIEFDGCSSTNVFLDLEACTKACLK